MDEIEIVNEEPVLSEKERKRLEKEAAKAEKEAAKEAKRIQSQKEQTARELRKMLSRYAHEERFATAVAQAIPLFWNNHYDLETADEMDANESFRFFDWFTYDYDLGDGQRLIDSFGADMKEELTAYQEEMVAIWQNARPSGAYEFLEFDPFSQQFQLKDFFTGEELIVYTSAGTGSATKGDIILLRPIEVGTRLEFSTLGAYIPQAEVEGLAEYMAAAKETYLAEHPDATHTQFLRANNHLLGHYAMQKSEEKGRYPVARLNPRRVDTKVRSAAKKITKKFIRRK
jgi:hypothetical protein